MILRGAGFEETFQRIKLKLVDTITMERRETIMLRALVNKTMSTTERSNDVYTGLLRGLSLPTDGRVPEFDVCRFIVDISQADGQLDNQN